MGAEVADKWNIKPSASTWTNDDLSHIGISYHDAEMKLSDLMEKMALSKTEYPPEQSLIVDGIKKIWTFSFEFDERYLRYENDKQQNMERGENGIKEVLKRLKGEQKIRIKRATIGTNREKGQVFDGWNVYLTDFMKYFRELVVRMKKKKCMQEEKFTHLFMLFSRIFFIRPEPGHTFKVSFDIKKEPVSGYPDVRFIAHESQKTIAVIEIKNEEVFKMGRHEEIPAISTHIPESLLGQHGMELLLEKPDSSFAKGVAGIVCTGTKVVFTFLEIDDDEYRKLKQYGTPTQRGRGKIYYTKHFDFMKTEDRNEIVIPLLKFAFLQSKTEHDSSNT